MNQSLYIQSINNVISYINAGLEQDLSLEKLGRISSFSPFHFQRLFKAYVGESPHDFIQRVRLEKAAALLFFQKDESVTDIALRTGFSSPASFARSFKAHYGISASQYRKSGSLKDGNLRKKCKELDDSFGYSDLRTGDRRSDAKPFQVTIKHLPSYQVAFIRLLGGLDKGSYNKEFTEAFHKVTNWCIDNKAITEPHMAIGIAYDHPDMTDVSKCRYDASVTILDSVNFGEGEVGVQKLPEGTYASIKIKMANKNEDSFKEAILLLGEAVDFLYRKWLPQSQYLLSDKPALDIYHSLPASDPIIIEHCLPVSLYKE